MPAPHIFIATHHKSGTVWMMTTFIRIAKANGSEFIHLNEGESGWNLREDKAEFFESKRSQVEDESDCPGIFFDFHGDIPDLTRCKHERGARGLHIVRDPRDLLISAARFHLVADESWLHEPVIEFGGMTYQQKLGSYDAFEDRIKFEIDHSMGRVIRQMNNFDDQGVFERVHYEDLIVDVDMVLFHRLMVHLGLSGKELLNGLGAFWESSIFGDRSEHDLESTRNHIFNSRPKQWQTMLSGGAIDLIQGAFEKEIVGSGYELR